MRSLIRLLPFATLALVLVPSCKGNTRAHALVEWDLYVEATGLFSFRYPDPPWELMEMAPGSAHLEIQHRGIIDRPMEVELLDVTVAGPAGDLDSFVAGRMAAVAAAGSTILCDEPPCTPDALETLEDERMLAFSHRTLDGVDAREYYVGGLERIISVVFIGVRDVTEPEYDLLAQSVTTSATPPQ